MTNAALLLTDPSFHLRLRVLTQIFHKPREDNEVRELQLLCKEDYLSRDIITAQLKNGSWKGTTVRNVGEADGTGVTARVVKRLGFLGFPPDHPSIKKAIAYIFTRQNKSGSWSPGKTKTGDEISAEATIIYTALILQGIALAGHGETREAQIAYDWLIGFRLPDGAWPAGMVEGNYRGVAGYRRLPHSKLGCRSTTTAITAALAYHPILRKSEMAGGALDLILAAELKEAGSVGFEAARTLGFEQPRGLLTHYVNYDCAFILDLCTRIGIGKTDERVADIINFLLAQQGPYGLWEYAPNPAATRWVTFDILCSLAGIDSKTTWSSMIPRSKFQKYPKKQKRY